MPETREWEVRIYATPEGKEPYVEWERALTDRKGQARVQARIGRVRLGNFGECEPVGDGVFELKIDVGPGYRVYFGRVEEAVVLLLCGGDKSTQNADITTAKAYWKNYKERCHDEDA